MAIEKCVVLLLSIDYYKFIRFIFPDLTANGKKDLLFIDY